jgi:hypothetical protein
MFGGMVVPERKKHLRPTQLRQWREYAGASQMEAAKAAGRTRLAVGLEAIENARKLSKKEFFYGYIEVASGCPKSPAVPSLGWPGTKNAQRHQRLAGRRCDAAVFHGERVDHALVTPVGKIKYGMRPRPAIVAVNHRCNDKADLVGLGREAGERKRFHVRQTFPIVNHHFDRLFGAHARTCS